MDVNEIKLNQLVTIKMNDGTIKEGVVKGLFEACDKTIKVKVEYEVPIQNDFSIDSIELKTE